MLPDSWYDRKSTDMRRTYSILSCFMFNRIVYFCQHPIWEQFHSKQPDQIVLCIKLCGCFWYRKSYKQKISFLSNDVVEYGKCVRKNIQLIQNNKIFLNQHNYLCTFYNVFFYFHLQDLHVNSLLFFVFFFSNLILCIYTILKERNWIYEII